MLIVNGNSPYFNHIATISFDIASEDDYKIVNKILL